MCGAYWEFSVSLYGMVHPLVKREGSYTKRKQNCSAKTWTKMWSWVLMELETKHSPALFPSASASTWTTASHPEYGGSIFLWNVTKLIYYTVQKPKRRPIDQQLPWKPETIQNLTYLYLFGTTTDVSVISEYNGNKKHKATTTISKIF